MIELSHLRRRSGHRIRSLGGHLNLAAKRSAEYSQRHFRFIGVLTTLIPAAYLADVLVGKPYFDTLGIRVVAFIFAIPVIFHDHRYVRRFQNFHIYFVCVVAYVLPFSYGLMLVLNAASSPQDQQIEMLWILQYVIALFLFIQLIHHGLLATILWSASTVMVLSSLALLEEINWNELNRVVVYPISAYLTALLFGIVTNRNVDYVNSEKLRAASAIGGNIAHELRTPLASIRLLARAMNRHSQILVDTYARARELNIHKGDLTSDQVSGLRTALQAIEEEVAYSNTIIDMLLLNTSEKASQVTAIEQFWMSRVVKEAVNRFPFNNSREKALVRIRILEDFSIDASRLFVTHVLFNLLKNGIYYAQKHPGGRVDICVSTRNGKGVVECTDTGPGISSDARKHIFDRFYTTSDSCQGAGIGLSFCKMVMESIGGEIHCESQEGQYTTFRLTFPTISPK